MIKTLILKDFFEFKNNRKKLLMTFGLMILLPIAVFNFTDVTKGILVSIPIFIEFIIILYTGFILSETTLFSIYRNIKEGVFEKYFINRDMKKIDIYVSKYVVNLMVVFIALTLMILINIILNQTLTEGTYIPINFLLVLKIIITTSIATSIGFICSLVIKDETNAIVYTAALMGTYLGYYKLLELLCITNNVVILLGLVAISIVLIVIVVKLLNENRFIRKS